MVEAASSAPAADVAASVDAALAALDISDASASSSSDVKKEELKAAENADNDPFDMSKTEQSQHLKGNQSYYYWHGDAERRRLTGEKPVPMPTPVKLASEAAAKEKRVKAIDTFTFLDDGDVVKVYIELNGPLIDVKIGDVTAEYEEKSFVVSIDTSDTVFRFTCDRLAHQLDALRCKTSVTKSRKLLLKLYKRNPTDRWQKLRAL